MIERVLEIIVEGGLIDKREIAQQVGIQIETLDDMIDLLCNRGYMRIDEQSCSESPSCSGCSLAGSCGSVDKLGKAFFVTDKGKKYAKSRRIKKQ